MKRIVAISVLVILVLGAGAALAFSIFDFTAAMMNYPAAYQAFARDADAPDGLNDDEIRAWRLGLTHGMYLMNAAYEAAIEADNTNYIVNTNTDKFHKPTCKSVKTIKSNHRYDYSGSRDLLIDLGFSPCGNCKP